MTAENSVARHARGVLATLASCAARRGASSSTRVGLVEPSARSRVRCAAASRWQTALASVVVLHVAVAVATREAAAAACASSATVALSRAAAALCVFYDGPSFGSAGLCV